MKKTMTMKAESSITINRSPKQVFAALIDVPHHADWAEGSPELVSLSDNPAKLGTTWEHRAKILGRELTTPNQCNVYETNRQFGWKAEKPFAAQMTFLLEPVEGNTQLTWSGEGELIGFFALTEPLVARAMKDSIQKSLDGLKAYLEAQA
jgi:uncharacterized protein YndB with AHSA1/START domain